MDPGRFTSASANTRPVSGTGTPSRVTEQEKLNRALAPNVALVSPMSSRLAVPVPPMLYVLSSESPPKSPGRYTLSGLEAGPIVQVVARTLPATVRLLVLVNPAAGIAWPLVMPHSNQSMLSMKRPTPPVANVAAAGRGKTSPSATTNVELMSPAIATPASIRATPREPVPGGP